MNRRDALKALGALASATGMTITPITVKDAREAALLVVKVKSVLSRDQVEHLKQQMIDVLVSTPLEGVRVLVMDANQVDLELIKR